MKGAMVASILVLADLALLSCKGPGTPAEQVDALPAPWSCASPSLIPAPVSRYAHGLELAAGRGLFISGQIPEDLAGGWLLEIEATAAFPVTP